MKCHCFRCAAMLVLLGSFSSCGERRRLRTSALSNYQELKARFAEEVGDPNTSTTIELTRIESILDSYGYDEVFIKRSSMRGNGVDLADSQALVVRFEDSQFRAFLTFDGGSFDQDTFDQRGFVSLAEAAEAAEANK